MHPELTTAEAYRAAHHRSLAAPDHFWLEVAKDYHWFRPPTQALQGGFQQADYTWFADGETNLSYNCLDRHLSSRPDQAAIVWESNDPAEASRTLTYRQLHAAVCQLANALAQAGLKKGDRVCLYMPMVPEAAIAMLAIVRLGAIHSIVFGGFSAQSLIDRINDSQCRMVITADSTYRGTKEVRLKDIVDEALAQTPSIAQVVVLRRTGSTVNMTAGRDVWWHDFVQGAPTTHTATPVQAEDPLFVLYTSGSTGKPKGIVHTTGGYMVYVGYTFRNVFQATDEDLYWCTADVGWITGHSYLVYGPLLNGVPTLMFEGIPNYPDFGRFWEVVARHRVTVFYTAPTAIRSLEAAGQHWVKGKDLSSLRVLGTVGEPINQEAWEWYHHHVGNHRLPIVDTWWQTETGGIMISNLAGVTPAIPTMATLPMPGIEPVLLDEKGREIPYDPQNPQPAEGILCIRRPWPSLARTTWGDHERFRSIYFTPYPGYYFTGDGARRDELGNYRITGRVDDVINVSGHRIGTAEVEDALNEHEFIVESAVVGYPHDIKGQGIYAYVIPTHELSAAQAQQLVEQARHMVRSTIGAFAAPDKIQVVRGLPKTRSGKIMRRILRKVAEGETGSLGDTSTLLDPTVVDDIISGARQLQAVAR